VVDTCALVEGEPELGQLHGHRRVDPGLLDPLDRRHVLVGSRLRPRGVGHTFTQQVQDAADAARVEVLDRPDRIFQLVAGDEPPDHLPR
jgi:hypothetical protein